MEFIAWMERIMERFDILKEYVLNNPFILTVRKNKKDKSYVPDSGALKQLKTIEQVIGRCDSIIVATDAGREGELIFRYIYEYLKFPVSNHVRQRTRNRTNKSASVPKEYLRHA